MAMASSDRACALLLLLPAVAVLLHGEPARSSAGFPLSGQATVRLPPAPHQPRFAARAVVLDDARGERQPGFVAAVSAEAARAGAGTCSLVLFLGGVKVWASDHLEEFVARALCRLELTEDGQLREGRVADRHGGTRREGDDAPAPFLHCLLNASFLHDLAMVRRSATRNYKDLFRGS